MNAQTMMTILHRYADRVLELGADRYSPQPTPLLVDGVEVATGEPVRWEADKDQVYSNFASQQNLMRVLVGLSALSGNERYANVATDISRYMLTHVRDDAGLMYWGGHIAWDLRNCEPFGHAMENGRPHHELKRHYPFYELMWQADPEGTRRYIRAHWNAHIADWSTLDFNRHGKYSKPLCDDSIWDQQFGDGPVFFVGTGLSFCNAGSDLYYSAAMLHHFTGHPGPLRWAQNMAKRYIDTSDPDTGLGGYQFSQIPRDRAQQQFGPEWGELALEGRIIDGGRAKLRYGTVQVCNLHLARTLGESGSLFRQWVKSDLTAFANHIYDADTNMVQPMWSNGIKLTPQDLKRPGYYSVRSLQRTPAGTDYLWPHASAYREFGDPLFWQTAAAIARGMKLGELPEDPRQPPTLVAQTDRHDPRLIFALIELYRASDQRAYLDLACKVAENIVTCRFHHDLFVQSARHRYARFDQVEPVALMTLAAALEGRDEAVPAYCDGQPNFAADHPCAFGVDRWNRISEQQLIYGQTV